MNLSTLALRRQRLLRLAPGVIVCVVIGAAARFLSEHYGAPVMLFALLLGIAMNFLADESACTPGIAFCARTVLRWGVALLGLRITAGEIAALGWQPVVGIIVAVGLTIVISVVAARLMGFRTAFGVLSGGATAICGASAAMALAAAMPPHPQQEKALSFTIIGISVLSTIAMVVYPIAVRAFGLDAQQAGIFLGGTIHDVAQVVGAGYSMSTPIGDTATVVKLLRVAMLVPVIALTAALMRAPAGQTDSQGSAPQRPPLLPWFVVAFAGLVLVNSLGWIAPPLAQAASALSGWCLMVSIAAIGVKTQLRELASVGIKPVLLMIGETILIAVIVLGLLQLRG